MKFERSSGVLLHPTSLPGEFGIGDLGVEAFRWIDFLASAGCSLWQVLPLGPTGFGDSPYQCFSAFAGNPYLISPGELLSEGLLLEDDLADIPDFPEGRVDFGLVIEWKLKLLDRAYLRFQGTAPQDIRTAFVDFCTENTEWLPDYALFMAVKDAHGGAAWNTWEPAMRERDPQTLYQALREYEASIERHKFIQFIFFRQWDRLHDYARQKGIRIIGDVPIFVAYDSAEVWAHPELFEVDKAGRPKVVAGVPPDYFSPTGQLWGNPLYRWRIHRQTGYTWWVARLRNVLDRVDIVRLDHFRGFAGYWEIPGTAKTAENGRWVSAPGLHFFTAIRKALGDLPIIAEDLGVITPDVVKLREQFGLPGMKILQFAFANGPRDPFLPHNYPPDCVVYTGTHDNDTALGWYERVSEEERAFFRRYLDRDGSNVAWDLIRACWSSVAVFSLAPFQDFLNLDNRARMNYPGNPSGNWQWRLPPDAMTFELQNQIRELNFVYDRMNPFSQG